MVELVGTDTWGVDKRHSMFVSIAIIVVPLFVLLPRPCTLHIMFAGQGLLQIDDVLTNWTFCPKRLEWNNMS